VIVKRIFDEIYGIPERFDYPMITGPGPDKVRCVLGVLNNCSSCKEFVYRWFDSSLRKLESAWWAGNAEYNQFASDGNS
jgi:hypothetical protein